jgi:phosphatidylglycerol lysyltransferase
MAILQVFLATIDVAVTATIFHALLPGDTELNWVVFLAVYLAAYTGGLAANLPGGIGVFDTAMLVGLSPFIEAPQIIAAIVVFRLYYYLLPLFIAGPLFSGVEIMQRMRVLGRRLGGKE